MFWIYNIFFQVFNTYLIFFWIYNFLLCRFRTNLLNLDCEYALQIPKECTSACHTRRMPSKLRLEQKLTSKLFEQLARCAPDAFFGLSHFLVSFTHHDCVVHSVKFLFSAKNWNFSHALDSGDQENSFESSLFT